MLGSCNETDFISRLLVGLAAVRAFPETDPARHTMVQSVPVDVTAAALCDLCAPRGPRRGEVLHVVSGAPPQPMASLRQALLAFGAISPNLRAASLVPVPPTSPPPPTPTPPTPQPDPVPGRPAFRRAASRAVPRVDAAGASRGSALSVATDGVGGRAA